jgi:hypothetical protein
MLLRISVLFLDDADHPTGNGIRDQNYVVICLGYMVIFDLGHGLRRNKRHRSQLQIRRGRSANGRLKTGRRGLSSDVSELLRSTCALSGVTVTALAAWDVSPMKFSCHFIRASA